MSNSDRGDHCATFELLFGTTNAGDGLSDSNAGLSAEIVCRPF